MPNDEKLFYSIGEVAEILQLKPYVLRYWESEFKKLTPKKSFTGQRTYRVRDIQLALTIKKLLYDDKYTIAGAIQKLDELDTKGELVKFPDSSSVVDTTPQPKSEQAAASPKVVAEVSSTSTIASVPEQPVSAKPSLDGQKVKDLKGLVEATKKLLKKYNLS